LGGEASVEIAKERLEAFDPWEAYAAVRVWLELGEPSAEEVAGHLEETEDEFLPSWREACRRLPPDRLRSLFPPEGPSVGSIRLQGVLAFAWGWNGLLSDELASRFAFSSDPAVRWSVARVLGGGAVPQQAPKLLPSLLTDPEVSVYRAALWSQVLLDPANALAGARGRLESGEPDPFAARVVGLNGGPADGELLRGMALHPEAGPECILALGDLGDLAAMEFLLDLLGDENADRAGAAEAAIDTLLGEVPTPSDSTATEKMAQGSGEEPGLTGESAFPEEEPPVDPEEAKKGWDEVAPSFDLGVRWLRGKPFPWPGPPADEPMERIWRTALAAERPEAPWLRTEVPDGFFSGLPSFEAVPGE